MRQGDFNAALASQLRCCLAALGMTPADRSRVSTSFVQHAMATNRNNPDRFFDDE